jgi:hypothetical protein
MLIARTRERHEGVYDHLMPNRKVVVVIVVTVYDLDDGATWIAEADHRELNPIICHKHTWTVRHSIRESPDRRI